MNYWDALAQADERLARGDLRAAEGAILEARELRERSPGRVFLTETLGDAARRLFRGIRRDAGDEAGRWDRALDETLHRFHAAADDLLARADRLDDPRPEHRPRDGELHQAVFLLLSARLHDRDPDRGAPLLLEALGRARATGALPPAELLPVGGGLPASALVPVMTTAVEALAVADGAGGVDRAAWAGAALALLDEPRSLLPPGDESRLALCRADLLDMGGDDPARVADAYAAYLASSPPSGPDRDRAQIRAASLCANIGVLGSPVPRYRDALDLLAMHRPDDPAARGDVERLTGIVERRRLLGVEGVWATVAPRQDGWTAVLWHGGTPRDAAHWSDGDGPDAMSAFLAVAGERVLSGAGRAPWTGFALAPLLEALDEPHLDPEGRPTVPVDPASLPATGTRHPLLDDGIGPDLTAALETGLHWRRVLDDLERGDPARRSGLHRLARMGDAAARFVTAFLAPELVPAETWELKPLARRPDPVLPRTDDVFEAAPSGAAAPEGDRVVVATGRPASVVGDWGAGRDRWRVVLDRPARLADLAATLRVRGGGFTLLPGRGRPDEPEAALAALEDLVSGDPGDPGMLAVFHWSRLCATHNGDLGDFADLRRRKGAGTGLWDRYLEWLERFRDDRGKGRGDWHDGLAERCATCEVVAGSDDLLEGGRRELADLWGVSPERPGAWIFCDSPVIHWRLVRTAPDAPRRLHETLAPLSSGHLSLLTASAFLRQEAMDAISGWIDGEATLAYTDARGPVLELAARGPVPDARVGLGALVEGILGMAERVGGGNDETLLVSASGSELHGILGRYARGEFAATSAAVLHVPHDGLWRSAGCAAGRPLVLTRLESLDGDHGAGPDGASWLARDERRRTGATSRRALCALELAACSALAPSTLTVTDPRWWRELPHLPRTGGALMPMAAEDALESATGGLGVLCDLPDRVSDDGPVRAWLTAQGWLGPDGSGRPPGTPPTVDDLAMDPTPGSGLTVGPAEHAWWAVLTEAWRRYESGDRADWLLVVAEAPPPGAAELAAASGLPAASVPDHRETVPGPLMWVRPVQLEDPVLRRRLAAAAPRVTWASDLHAWLPSDHGAGDEYAGAVRFLLRELRGELRLHASRLPAPWRRAWPDLVQAAGREAVPVVGDDASEARPGDEPAVPVIRFGHPVEACPSCGTAVELKSGDVPCPACGLDVLRWISRDRRRLLVATLRRMRLAALNDRETGEDESPLCIWVPPRELDAWTEALDELGRPWRRAVSRTLDGRGDVETWHVCLLGDQPEVPAECRHAVMAPPADAGELRTLRRDCGEDLALWFHPLELALLDTCPGRHGGPTPSSLLPEGDPLAAPMDLDPGWRWSGILTPDVQEIVSGLPAAHVRRLRGTAAWLDAVTGEDRPVSVDPGLRRVEPRFSRVESEFRRERGLKTLATLLPTVLTAGRPGAVALTDLADLPVEIDTADLAWCDRMLLALSGAMDEAGPGAPRLLYVPDGGLARSSRRIVGRLGSPAEVAAALDDHIRRIGTALWSPFREDDATDTTTDPDGLDADLLAAGILSGQWLVSGRPGPGELTAEHDAGTGTRRTGTTALARQLVTAQHRDRAEWRARLEAAWRVGFFETLAPAPVRRRPDSFATAEASRKEVGPLADFLKRREGGLKLLTGPRGSGRFLLAAEALGRTCPDPSSLRHARILAPDAGTAARFHGAWRTVCPGREVPRIGLIHGGSGPLRRPDPRVLPSSPGGIVVLLGFEELPAALRYRLTSTQGEERILAVLDPHRIEESWEHLLMEQPEAGDVVTLERLTTVARDLREERADWLAMRPGGLRLEKTARRDKGSVDTMPVTNLDNALAVLAEQCTDEALAAPVEVVAPLLTDLDYLGRGAARLGWLPVYRWELDALLLPGAAETMAVACDVAELPAADDDLPTGRWLCPLLPTELRAAYREWLRGTGPETTMADLLAALRRSGWGADPWSAPEAATRAERLVSAAPDEPVARAASRTLAEVWRLAVASWPGMPREAPSGPVLTLTTADRAGGGDVDVLVHLCTGNEGAAHHERIAARARTRLLLLHQAVSPLARDMQDG